jgi:hypothetical protein
MRVSLSISFNSLPHVRAPVSAVDKLSRGGPCASSLKSEGVPIAKRQLAVWGGGVAVGTLFQSIVILQLRVIHALFAHVAERYRRGDRADLRRSDPPALIIQCKSATPELNSQCPYPETARA